MTTFLAPDEVAALTGRRRCDAQVRELVAMGIPHVVRSDGTPAVLRAAVEGILGAPAPTPARPAEPRLRP